MCGYVWVCSNAFHLLGVMCGWKLCSCSVPSIMYMSDRSTVVVLNTGESR